MLGLRHANLYFKSNLREKQRDHPYKSETPCNFLETLGLEKKKPKFAAIKQNHIIQDDHETQKRNPNLKKT